MSPKRKNIVDSFCRHLVGLSVTYKHKADDAGDRARFGMCSGTLIMIEGGVFLLTAGHVLKQLDELRESGGAEIIGASLADTFASERISDIPIPFDLKSARLFYIDDEDDGLDFGVIALEPHHVRMLAKNGMVALTEENWVHQHTVKFEAYALLGLPEELATERVSSSGEGAAAAALLTVKRLESAPPGRKPTRYPQFVGQLHPEMGLKSVKGMSGGPILGFRREPEPRYWIVALQSSWDEEARIVYGCDLPILASLMSEWARQVPAA